MNDNIYNTGQHLDKEINFYLNQSTIYNSVGKNNNHYIKNTFPAEAMPVLTWMANTFILDNPIIIERFEDEGDEE